MAYFRILNARQPVMAGGLSIEPEPLFLQNGSWVGVISTENEGAIKDLSENALVNVISKEDYDSLKKRDEIHKQLLSNAGKPGNTQNRKSCGACGSRKA